MNEEQVKDREMEANRRQTEIEKLTKRQIEMEARTKEQTKIRN